MARSLFSSPLVSVVLALALALSLAFPRTVEVTAPPPPSNDGLLEFRTVPGLSAPPTTHVSRYGEVRCDCLLKERHADPDLLVLDAKGRPIAHRKDGSGREWSLTFERVPPAGCRVVFGESEHTLEWPQTIRLADVRASSDSVRINFSHWLDRQEFEALVAVTPRPDGLTMHRDGSTIRLRAVFKPGQQLSITVRKGLRADSGLKLAEDVTRSIRIPDHEPRLRFTQDGATLSLAAVPELEVEGVNIDKVEFAIARVFSSNVVPMALDWKRARQLTDAAVTRRVPVGAARNEKWTRRFNLADLLGEQPRGVYVVRLRGEWESGRRNTRTRTRMIQVTDLAPIVRQRAEGAVVFLVRISDGMPVAGADVTAYTDRNQIAARGRTNDDGIVVLAKGGDAAVITVRHGKDLAYVGMARHALAHEGVDVEGRPPVPAPGLEAFVYTDRGVVRPGGTCHLGAIIRTADGDAVAAGLPLTIEVRGANGRLQKTVHSRGPFVTADVAFPLDAATGSYTIEVLTPGQKKPLGHGAFLVEAFLPDRIEPSISLPEGDLKAGARVEVGVSAKLLTGRPTPGLLAKLSVRYTPTVFDARDGFVFGDTASAPEPFREELGEARLDAKGHATLTTTLPKRGMRAVFELEVIDVSGRAAFSRIEKRVLLFGGRLGIAPPQRGAFELAVVAIGAPLPADATAELMLLTWHGAYEDGRWRAVLVAKSIASTPVRDGKAVFSDPGNGRFSVRVAGNDCEPAAVQFERRAGRLFRAIGMGAPRLLMRWTNGVLEVDAPFAGRALLTLEGPGILDARLVTLAAGTQTLSITPPQTRAPNLYATCTLVRARGERVLGAVSIPVARPKLDVELEAPTEVRPETDLTATVSVSQPADVVVYLVDEGVLRRTTHPTPDPAAFFCSRRRLDTRLADGYTRLLDRMRFSSSEPGGDAEGGTKEGALQKLAGRLDPTARRTIETVALASRRLHVKESGTVTFAVPAYEGRLRLFAVAAGPTAVGSAARPVRVKALVSITIHAPRVVAPGDLFEVPIETDAEVRVVLHNLERVGNRLRAVAPGTATITVIAKQGTRRARFRVRSAAPYTVRHILKPHGRLPEGWLGRKASIRVGGAELELLPALERLAEYPYGCVEQTTSRAFPMLAWAELARTLHPDGGRPRDSVAAAIERLFSMQTPRGGLATWPGGLAESRFGSVYAAHFLVEAKRLGRRVPDRPLARLLDRIESYDADAHAAYVLTLAGRTAYLELPVVTIEDRAHLAAAYLLRGDRKPAEELLAEVGDPWSTERRSGGSLASPTRAAATLLGALVTVNRKDPRIAPLALRLRSAARRAADNTTQENAAALLALAKLRAQSRPPSGTLTVDGVPHLLSAGLRLDVRESWRLEGDASLVLRLEGVPPTAPEPVARGMSIRRTIRGKRPFVSGRVYEVVIEGEAIDGGANLLVTDLLPGGFEIEAARNRPGTLEPDRVDARDDRVLFFRTSPIRGRFRQTYLVRAVTVGTFVLPPVQAELLYDPAVVARTKGGEMIEITR